MIRIENQDLGISYRDSGPWRNYELTTHGKTMLELLENAAITEVDQDGGEISTYDMTERAPNEVYNRAIEVIGEIFEKAKRLA